MHCWYNNIGGYKQADDQSLYEQEEYDSGECNAKCADSCKDKAASQQADLSGQMLDEAPKRGGMSQFGKDHGFVTVVIKGGTD